MLVACQDVKLALDSLQVACLKEIRRAIANSHFIAKNLGALYLRICDGMYLIHIQETIQICDGIGLLCKHSLHADLDIITEDGGRLKYGVVTESYTHYFICYIYLPPIHHNERLTPPL
ncbi:hypothetical protein ACJX0J_039505, partial [Zea mays]